MARLTLRLLGGFQAHLGPDTLLPLTARKAQALLAYLGTRPGQSYPRDKLATLLWPDTSDVQSRQSLRVALVILRRAIGSGPSPILVAEGESLALSSASVEVDVAAFERCVAAGTPDALAEAARLYQGDFLEGFRVTEPLFEDWLRAERVRLQELALEGLAKLLHHQQGVGATEAAVQTALRLLALDPLQEPVHRALMRLYAREGRRGAALRQYQVCMTVLRRELGAEPEAETRLLFQELVRRPNEAGIGPDRRGDAPRLAPTTAPVRLDLPAGEAPLFGRETELEQLRALLDEAIKGHGYLAAVVGEAGIGKTRLLGALAMEALQHGCQVLIGRCHESDSILPFGPWVDACRESGLSADEDILRRLPPTWRAELSRLLPEVNVPGLPRPSHSDLRLFEGVAQLAQHAAARQPLVLILEDLHWADEVSLRLLAFVTRRARGWAALVVTTAREEELADAAMARRIVQELAHTGQAVPIRLSPLSRSQTMCLVRALARAGDAPMVAGVEEQVWTLSEGNPLVVVETMRALCDGTVLPNVGTLPLPRRVRDLISSRLERLTDRARELASVAAVIGREFDFSLLHRAGGLALHYLRRAGAKALARSAYREAGSVYEYALAVLARLPETPATAADNIDIRLAICTVLNARAEYERALDTLRPAEAMASALGDAPRLGRVLARMCLYLRMLGDHRRAVPVGQRALATADGLADSALQAWSRFWLSHAYYAASHPRQAAELLRHIVEAPPEGRSRERLTALAHSSLAVSLAALGRFDEAEREGEEGLRFAEAANNPWLLVSALACLARASGARGDFHRAIALAERGLALAQTWSILDWGWVLNEVLSSAYNLAGRVNEAIFHAEQAVAAPPVRPRAVCLLPLADAFLLAGRSAEALESARGLSTFRMSKANTARKGGRSGSSPRSPSSPTRRISAGQRPTITAR